jgi:hypothetical protein
MIDKVFDEDIIIIDDALPEELFKQIKNEISKSEFPWYYTSSSAYPLDDQQQNVYEYSFSHVVYENSDKKSAVFEYCYSGLLAALSKINLRIKNLIRIRLGMHTANENHIINDPHVDFENPHVGALLYLNDCNADTYFFKQIYNGSLQKYEDSDFEKDVVESVAPKENRLVLFNGLRYHSSSKQTDVSRRIVINYNFEI